MKRSILTLAKKLISSDVKALCSSAQFKECQRTKLFLRKKGLFIFFECLFPEKKKKNKLIANDAFNSMGESALLLKLLG